MPPIEDGRYLVNYLWEVGPTADAGPLTHEELRAWQVNVGLELQPWELRVLRRLSCEYASESHKAMKRDCPAPWKTSKADLSAVSNSMKRSLRAMANL